MKGPNPQTALPTPPWWLRAWEALARGFEKPVRLSPDALIAKVEREAGVFEDRSFEPALAAYCGAFEGDSSLTTLGRRTAPGVALDALRRGRSVERAIAADPAIATVPIEAPIFIQGAPRTGTTLLQSLLAADPEHRALLPWEIALPYPAAKSWGGPRDRRRAAHEKLVARVRRQGDGLDAIHPIDSPAECWQLLWTSFVSETVFLFLGFGAPYARYRAQLPPESAAVAYRRYRRQLQHFSWLTGGSRWVLKAPEHTIHLPALLAEFPDAIVLQLQRDPVEVIPSLCALAYHCQYLTVRDLRPETIGEQVLGVMAGWRARSERDRRALSPEAARRVHDVSYQELNDDPAAAVEKLYERIGRKLSDQAAAAMRAWLDERHGPQRPRRRATPAEFGLSPERIRNAFDFDHARLAEALP